jgi:hypothetical protein
MGRDLSERSSEGGAMSRRYFTAICLAFIMSGAWLGATPVSHTQTNPEKAPSQKEAKEARTKKPDPEAEDLNKKRKRLTREAIQALEDAIARAKKLQNPVVRIKIRSLAADALWDYKEEEARAILTEEFRGIASMTVPQEDENKPPVYKKRKLEDVKAGLKKELMVMIGSHDAALAHSLLAAEVGAQGDNGGETKTMSEMLEVAIDLSAGSAEAATRIIKDSLKTEINPKLAFSLIALRQYAPAEASAVFNQALSDVKVRGDLWEFYKLTPYVLPTEAERMTNGSYLADPERAKDARKFIESAAALLVKRLETPPAEARPSPELIANETYFWRSLLQLFNDLMPDKVWMVNTRISQLAALRAEAGKTEAIKKTVESGEQPPLKDMLKKRIADAEAATGARRDNLFSSAAFAALRLEDYEQAMSLIDKVENREQKEIDGSFIMDKASRKALSLEGPDKALEVASKIKWPSTRVMMFSRIINALRSLGRREQAAAVTYDLAVWLSGYDNNTDKVWGMLTYLDHFAKDDTEKAFAMLGTLITLLNTVNLEPPASPWAQRLYWYLEFHNFRKSLGALAKADFERASLEIQMLKNPEVYLLVQVALSGEYLKTLKKPSPT